MEKQRIAKTKKVMLTPRMAGTRVGGSAKFDWIPGGGLAAGIVFNTVRGMLSMSFGSTLLVDMIVSKPAIMTRDQSDFRNKRPSIDLIYIYPWRLEVDLHAA